MTEKYCRRKNIFFEDDEMDFFWFFFPVRYILRLSKKPENSAVARTRTTLRAHFDKNHGIWRNAVLLQRRLHIPRWSRRGSPGSRFCRDVVLGQSRTSIRKSLIKCKNHWLNFKIKHDHGQMITEYRIVGVQETATDTRKINTYFPASVSGVTD